MGGEGKRKSEHVHAKVLEEKKYTKQNTKSKK
jgi:hypothetical protein